MQRHVSSHFQSQSLLVFLNHFKNLNKAQLRRLKLSLRSNFVRFQLFLELKSLDILALCESNLEDSINLAISISFCDSKRFLLLICMTLQFMRRRDVLLQQNCPQKTPKIFTFFLQLVFTSFGVFFCSIDHRRLLCVQFLMLFHLKQIRPPKVLSVNPTVSVFFFLQTLTSIIRDCQPTLMLTCSLSQTALLRWLTFPF